MCATRAGGMARQRRAAAGKSTGTHAAGASDGRAQAEGRRGRSVLVEACFGGTLRAIMAGWATSRTSCAGRARQPRSHLSPGEPHACTCTRTRSQRVTNTHAHTPQHTVVLLMVAARMNLARSFSLSRSRSPSSLSMAPPRGAPGAQAAARAHPTLPRAAAHCTTQKKQQARVSRGWKRGSRRGGGSAWHAAGGRAMARTRRPPGTPHRWGGQPGFWRNRKTRKNSNFLVRLASTSGQSTTTRVFSFSFSLMHH